jgi:hypothetical protein
MKNNLKKAVLGVSLILVFYGILSGGTTALQAFPFYIYTTLAVLEMVGKKLNVWLVILSGLMFLVNLTLFSLPDMIIWALVFALYIKE